jgi:hypothetical protein
MANFHSLAAAHLALMLTLALIIDSGLSWSLLKRVLIGAMGFVLCALPVILTFLPSVEGRVTVTPDEALVMRARYDFVIRPSLEDFLILVVTFAPIAVLAGVSLYRVSRRQDGQRGILRAYLSLCLIVLLLPWVGTLINALTLSFMQLELLRFTRYYFALSFTPVAMLLASWMKKGSQGRSPAFTLLAVICLIGTMVLSRPQVGKLIVIKGLDRIESESESTAPASDSAEYPTMVRDWRAFSELSEWVDSNTPVDALFLAPVDWSEFRVYARRGMVVSWKATWWEQWGEHYMTVYDLYSHPDAQQFVKVAKEYEVDYVVVMRGLDLPDLDVVYENSFYVVYKVE